MMLRLGSTQVVHAKRRQTNLSLLPLVSSLFYLFGPVPKATLGPQGWALTIMAATHAQVRPDATLSTTVRSTDNLNFVIEGGDRPLNGSQNGPNLFHSFDIFSVPEGGSVQFNNPLDITHIIGRVTGAQPSIIEGRISAQGDANLFLINPQGILLGPNAHLDIGGSFLASTADQMMFQDGTVFSASDPSLPLLTVSVPAGLQMGSDPQPIYNQSQALVDDSVVGLTVVPKETVGLVGGAIDLDGGHITTSNSRVEVGGVGANQTVGITLTPTGYELNYDRVSQFADIVLTNASVIDSSGIRGGAIQIQGESVRITDGSVIGSNTLGPGEGSGRAIAITAQTLQIDNQSSIETETRGDGNGGPIHLNARESIQFTGPGYDQFIADVLEFVLSGSPEANAIYTRTNGNGNAGNVRIKTPLLVLTEGGSIGSSTSGIGNSGNLVLDITDRIEAHSSSLATSAVFESIGNSGDIRIKTRQLTIKDGQQISSTAFGSGNSGDINIMAPTILMADERTQFPDVPEILAAFPLVQAVLLTSINSAASIDAGNAGTLSIESDTLSLQGGSLITTATIGQADGGDIVINTGHLSLAGNTLQPNLTIRTGISSATLDAGNAGDIDIRAERITLYDGNVIDSSSFNIGNAGNVRISASEKITVQGRTLAESKPSIISSRVRFPQDIPLRMPIEPQDLGDAGNLELTAPSINIAEGGEISISAGGRGSIGELAIATHAIRLDEGRIVAESNMGQGGDIVLNATESVLLQNGSVLSSRSGLATNGQGDGGNIEIHTPVLLGFGNSDIIADAVMGRGGRIEVITRGLFGLAVRDQLTADNDMVASSTSGISGTVTIRSPAIDPGADSIVLPTMVSDPSEEIATTCDITNGSQFVMTGRGGLPMTPERYSDHSWSNLLPDFGHIPTSIAHLPSPSPPIDNHAPISPRPSAPFLPRPTPTIPQEATTMAIAPNGSIQLASPTAFVSVMPTKCGRVPEIGIRYDL